MNRPSRIHLSVVTAFVLTLSVCVDAKSANEGKPQPACPPISLYHQVWKLVKDSYYDSSYNSQDWTRWEHRYDKQLNDMDDSRKAVETMLASLGDRYTRYLNPSAFEGETELIAAKLFGIGIQMGLDKTSRLVVIAPIEGTPAAKAGLMPRDEIVSIDGKATNGLSVEQASKAIRGPSGTVVVLNILRDNKLKEFNITRGEITIHSVHDVMMLNNEVGYIRLGTFMSQRANDEMREALVKLTPARGIILDLRNNPGGLVTNAVDICSMFLDGGIVVSTVDRDGSRQTAHANGRPISTQAVVVLINEGSASASEITSGALHDSKRAELVGQKSFGKGLVQSITRLEDTGGVNITIARYLTPNNVDIHKVGILPDYEVDLKTQDYKDGRGPWFLYGRDEKTNKDRTPGDGKDVQLAKALEVLNRKIESASAPPIQIKLNPLSGLNAFPNSLSPSGSN